MLTCFAVLLWHNCVLVLFLNELGIDGVGTEVDLAQGFALFFRMSLGLGGAAVGMARLPSR